MAEDSFLAYPTVFVGDIVSSPAGPVLDALSELDRIDRAALYLIYWRGLSQSQVAAELGVPVGTIRAAVAHGMRQLAHRISGP